MELRNGSVKLVYFYNRRQVLQQWGHRDAPHPIDEMFWKVSTILKKIFEDSLNRVFFFLLFNGTSTFMGYLMPTSFL